MKIKVTKKKRPDPQSKTDSFFPPNQRLNEKIIELLEELASIMMKHGEPFRARAYQKATETIILYPTDITPANYKAMEKQPGIGSTIIEKLDEYIKTGTLRVLERERENPVNILADVYGVGPKKAKELVNKGIKTIAELREHQDELNNVQKIGLKYYEDILKRIPRKEIDDYHAIFQNAFQS
jgi:DNA polymerase/3'-5' exonuclease PolX